MCCARQEDWNRELDRRVMLNGYVTLPFKLRANGCNNSQHLLGVIECVLAVVCKKKATTPNNVGT